MMKDKLLTVARHAVNAIVCEDQQIWCERFKKLLNKGIKAGKRNSMAGDGTDKYKLMYLAGRSPPLLCEILPDKIGKQYALPLVGVEERRLTDKEGNMRPCTILKTYNPALLRYEDKYYVGHPTDQVASNFRDISSSVNPVSAQLECQLYPMLRAIGLTCYIRHTGLRADGDM